MGQGVADRSDHQEGDRCAPGLPCRGDRKQLSVSGKYASWAADALVGLFPSLPFSLPPCPLPPSLPLLVSVLLLLLLLLAQVRSRQVGGFLLRAQPRVLFPVTRFMGSARGHARRVA